jgi:hypothetical protein
VLTASIIIIIIIALMTEVGELLPDYTAQNPRR